jgi:hypothetical protein
MSHLDKYLTKDQQAAGYTLDQSLTRITLRNRAGRFIASWTWQQASIHEVQAAAHQDMNETDCGVSFAEAR